MRHLSSPGELIDGRYRVARVLGRGSMADVYEAFDEKRTRHVAVKVLRRTLQGDAEALERLQREARVQEMISNPHVAALYGGGVTPLGSPYLVVELLRGRSLRDVLRAEGRVGAVRAASYCWQALQGLAAIHQVGVLHRDLKPANMMLEASAGPVDKVVLIDFGFAALEGSRRLTAAGHVVGSLAYLAPERLLGEPGDERSDLYAVGVILYELLVGRRPFVAETDIELMNHHLESDPVPPRQACPEADIPEPLQAVVMGALSKKPEQRAKSARHMAESLEEAAQHTNTAR
jgi:serine/threonine-protein kinase